MISNEDEDLSKQYISIYVRNQEKSSDKWKDKFFECMGGKSHIQCKCCNFPLIPTRSLLHEKTL